MIKGSKEYYARLKKALSTQDWQCTMWFDGPWSPCCRKHDYDSADATALKSSEERRLADLELKACVNEKVKGTNLENMGDLMYNGIRFYLNLRKIIFRRPKY